MTIKEVAQLTGLSHQAIYKKLKARGHKVETLKNKETGQLTEDGERIIRELFNLSTSAPEPVATEVEKLTTENEKLRNQVANLEKRVEELTGERDFLRRTLDTTTEALTNAQKLQAATLAKMPLLPSGEPGRLRKAWDKIRGRGHNGNQGE